MEMEAKFKTFQIGAAWTWLQFCFVTGLLAGLYPRMYYREVLNVFIKTITSYWQLYPCQRMSVGTVKSLL